MTHVIDALDIAEDVLLPALRTLGEAHWSHAPHGTVGRLTAAPSERDYLRRVFVAQHQAAGGPAPLVGSAGWSGSVTVKCLSADRALARAGRDLIDTKMHTLTSPPGAKVSAKYTGPMPTLRDTDGIYSVGSIYELTIRHVPVV